MSNPGWYAEHHKDEDGQDNIIIFEKAGTIVAVLPQYVAGDAIVARTLLVLPEITELLLDLREERDDVSPRVQLLEAQTRAHAILTMLVHS